MGYRRAAQAKSWQNDAKSLDLASHQPLFCTNCSLKLGYMKKEFWVIVDKYATVKILFEMY